MRNSILFILTLAITAVSFTLNSCRKDFTSEEFPDVKITNQPPVYVGDDSISFNTAAESIFKLPLKPLFSDQELDEFSLNLLGLSTYDLVTAEMVSDTLIFAAVDTSVKQFSGIVTATIEADDGTSNSTVDIVFLFQKYVHLFLLDFKGIPDGTSAAELSVNGATIKVTNEEAPITATIEGEKLKIVLDTSTKEFELLLSLDSPIDMSTHQNLSFDYGNDFTNDDELEIALIDTRDKWRFFRHKDGQPEILFTGAGSFYLYDYYSSWDGTPASGTANSGHIEGYNNLSEIEKLLINKFGGNKGATIYLDNIAFGIRVSN